MNKITNEQLDALIKSAVNSSGPLPPDEKFSQIISALRELRDLRASMLQGAENAESRCTTQTAPALVSLPKNAESRCGNSPVVPDGWVMVPVEPTEDMIVNGFESEPDESFSDEKEWEAYNAMSGCQQAAHRAKLCWAAMIAASPAYKKVNRQG